MTTTDNKEDPLELKKYSTAQRREWLLDFVKKKTWFVVKTRGQIKHFAETFGVDRSQIENDLKLIAQEASVADIGQIEMDMRHLFSKALLRADQYAEDQKLPEQVRRQYNQQVLAGIPRQAQILVGFGKMDKDISPPPVQEARPDEIRLDEIARDFAREWRAKNRPQKPEGV